ncbi:MAG: hypothetical protein ACJA0G_000965 [Kangiellaceae bacterium]|jgi:hypothetical protein
MAMHNAPQEKNMKRLFIVISLIAMAYLAMQTNTVKSAVNNIFIKASHANKSDIDIPKADPQLKNSALIEQLTALSTQTVDENRTLNTRVKRLEGSVAILENKLVEQLSGQLQSTKQLQANSQIVQPAAKAVVANRVYTEGRAQDKSLSKPVNDPSTAAIVATIIHAPEISKNEQQKRIKQQAILRALSQKMELAALSGLSN